VERNDSSVGPSICIKQQMISFFFCHKKLGPIQQKRQTTELANAAHMYGKVNINQNLNQNLNT
jgi:hypothetical protein